jgi:proteasome lid subunit RPN8/RPN11
MPIRLFVPKDVYSMMIAQALSEQPNECCGLLAGVREATEGVARVQRIYPLVNAAASPVEYLSDARSMFEAMRDMRRLSLDVLAVYHSHPTTAPVPSRKDLERNYSEEVMNLIVSLMNAPPEVRAWWLTAETYREADWEIADCGLRIAD